MKTKEIIAASLLLVCCRSYATPVTFDDFNDSSINTSLWNVSLPNSSSQVSEAGGNAVLVARGGLNTVASYSDSVDISGRFQFAGSLDHFRVVFRSDLSFNSPTFEKSGMIVVFDQDGQVQIGESEISTLALGTFNPNGWVDFRITDDGNNVKLFVNDLTTPLLTADSTYRTGDRVGFYNREFPFNTVDVDYLRVASVPDSTPTIPVQIDIKPGASPNPINLKSKGNIPIAILSTSTFDAATQIDQSSLTFGRTGDEKSLLRSNLGDVNGDGRLDITCFFDTQKTSFQRGDVQGVLKGKTINGVPIIGTDSVRIVP